MPTLTEQLTDLILDKPISEEDIRRATFFALDAIANALAGRNSEPGRILLDFANTRVGLDAGRNAFLVGALTHILEMDDLHRNSVVHPGCVVVPAVWAAAEREQTDGHHFLVAVLRGFEAACRVGMAVGAAHYRIWHNTATCGPYGSAMGVGSLIGLDRPETVHALGNAGTQSAGLWQFLETAAMTKHLHAGRAAEAGVTSAYLAALGFTGPPAILEGEKGFFAAACPDADPPAVLRAPDAPWQLTRTSIKPWPSCRHTHPAIDAALELAGPFEFDAVEQIEVDTYPAAVEVCDRANPVTPYEAKFSLQHCVAAALSGAPVDFDAFEGAARERHAALRAKVSLNVSEPYASAYPGAWGSAVTLRLKDGRVRSARREHARGDPDAPLSEDELIAKAHMLLEHGAAPDPDRIVSNILNMADGGPVPALDIRSPIRSPQPRSTAQV